MPPILHNLFFGPFLYKLPDTVLLEQFSQFIFFQFCTNHTEFACHFRLPCPDIMFLRYIVEINPCAVLSRHHAFRPKYCAILTAVQ